MNPLDFKLMVEGWNAAHTPQSNEPGSNAPTLERAQELMAEYG